MAPLQAAYLDVPLVGVKQSQEPQTAPLDGVYLLENYTLERTGAARKRRGLAAVVSPGAAISRVYDQSGGTQRLEMTDGTYRVRNRSNLSNNIMVYPGDGLGIPLMPDPPSTTVVQQSVPTVLVDSCNTHCARTANFVVVVTQEFLNTPAIKAAVYTPDGTCLRPATPLPGFSLVASSAVRMSVVAGSDDDFAVVYSDDVNGTSMVRMSVTSGIALAIGVGPEPISAGSLEDACRGPGGTIAIGTLSGTNAVISLRRIFDGVQVASLSLPSAAGPATRFAINVGATLARAAAVVCGTVGASNATSYLLELTPISVTLLAASASTLPNPSALSGLSTLVMDETATGLTVSHLVISTDNSASVGTGLSTGPITTISRIAAGGTIRGSSRLLAWLPAAKGYSPHPGRAALPMVCLDYRGLGTSGSSIVGATVQPYGYGYAIVDPAHLTDSTANAPFFLVRSWHSPGRGLRFTGTPRLANYASLIGGFEGVFSCLTAYDRASSASVESIRAVIVRTPPLPGGQPLADRRTPTTAQATPATTLWAGGALTALHGMDTRPAADLHPADIISIKRNSGGGTWPATSISVRARYVWLDSSGSELVSAWSLPTQIGVDSTISSLDIEIRLPQYLPGTCVTRPHLQIATANGTSTAFTKAMIEPQALLPVAATVPTLLQASPTQVVRLTTGGLTSATINTDELANVMPPPPRYISVGRQRALLVSAEDERVYYSKPLAKGIIPEWALELTLEPPPSVGTPVACEEIGDKIVVLGSTGSCYFLGDGQDANGDGSPYAGPYEALSGLGCDSIESVCSTPIGLFYRSQHTIVLIDSGLQPQPLGREIYDVLVAAPFTLRSQYHERSNSVFWLLSSPFGTRTIVILNLSTMSWTSWTTDQEEFVIQDIVVSGTKIYAAGSGFTGFLTQYQDETPAADGYDLIGILVQGRLVTPYIRLEQVQKFQRLWNVQCLVDVKAAGNTLSLSIYRDEKTASEAIATKTFAAAGVQPVNFHIPANLQRCSSVRLELRDGQSAPVPGTLTAGVDLLGITLEIGVKRGLRPVPSSQRA